MTKVEIIQKALELGGYDEDKQFKGINGRTDITCRLLCCCVLSVNGTGKSVC